MAKKSTLEHTTYPTAFSMSGTTDSVADVILRILNRNGWKIATILLDEGQASWTYIYDSGAQALFELCQKYPNMTVSIITFNYKDVGTMNAALLALRRHSRGIRKSKHFSSILDYLACSIPVSILMTTTFVALQLLVSITYPILNVQGCSQARHKPCC